MSLKDLTKQTAGTVEKWEPPKADAPKTVRVEWNELTWDGQVNLLTPSQKLLRDRQLARFADGSAAPEAMPRFRYWLALATIRVAWPDLPEWMDWLVTNHEDTALDLLDQVEGHEATFRERAGLQGSGAPGAPVVSAAP